MQGMIDDMDYVDDHTNTWDGEGWRRGDDHHDGEWTLGDE